MRLDIISYADRYGPSEYMKTVTMHTQSNVNNKSYHNLNVLAHG